MSKMPKVHEWTLSHIFHSDRGSQYTSHEVRSWLVAQAMRQSISGTGICYENAPMESYWHSMKEEETHGQDFATRAAATHSVFAYIEGWYNTTRMHSTLDYKSPMQFERDHHATLLKAANDELISISRTTANPLGYKKESGLNPQRKVD